MCTGVLWQNHVSMISLFCRIFCVKNPVLLNNKITGWHVVFIYVEESIALMTNKCNVPTFERIGL